MFMWPPRLLNERTGRIIKTIGKYNKARGPRDSFNVITTTNLTPKHTVYLGTGPQLKTSWPNDEAKMSHFSESTYIRHTIIALCYRGSLRNYDSKWREIITYSFLTRLTLNVYRANVSGKTASKIDDHVLS